MDQEQYMDQNWEESVPQVVEEPQPYRMNFADNVYETNCEAVFVQPEEKAPRKKQRRGVPVWLCILLAAVLVIVSSGVTVVLWDQHWQVKMDDLTRAMNDKHNALQQQINSLPGGGAGAAGTVEGWLTPGQVYARNVDAVVAVECTVQDYSVFGQAEVYDSFGSGFIISEDGYVLTNCHVIEGATSVSVTTRNGSRHGAAIVGYDATNDVALLKVDAGKFPCVTIGSSADLIVGDQVAAIGNPLGELTSTMTVGYVSGKERDVTTDGTTINMIQTDAAINSGNSGGPLFNMKGEVVGITTAKYSGNSSSGASIEGIGFAIPIDDVMKVVADLKEFGYVKSAYMGIMVRDLNVEMAEIYGLPVGAYVDSVEAGGPAAKAGMQAKDIITGLGEFTIRNMSDLTRALRTFEPGDTTTVYIYRAGAQLQLQITLMERPREADTTTPTEPESGMPNEGSYEEWFDYFFPFG